MTGGKLFKIRSRRTLQHSLRSPAGLDDKVFSLVHAASLLALATKPLGTTFV